MCNGCTTFSASYAGSPPPPCLLNASLKARNTAMREGPKHQQRLMCHVTCSNRSPDPDKESLVGQGAICYLSLCRAADSATVNGTVAFLFYTSRRYVVTTCPPPASLMSVGRLSGIASSPTQMAHVSLSVSNQSLMNLLFFF